MDQVHDKKRSLSTRPESALHDGSTVFQDYMRRKIQKQREQFGAVRSSKNLSDAHNIFNGIVVLVNGYTEPDADTIMRLMHQYGGDLEKYETNRVTHIIAERLSDAKANMYRKQRKRPTPVCKPRWILDSIRAHKLLPHGPYLVDQLASSNMSVTNFFNPHEANNEAPGVTKGTVRFADLVENSTKNTSPEKIKCAVNNEQIDLVSVSIKDDVHRTVGNDPNFLESYFNSSRLSFIGSYKQRSNNANKSLLSMDKPDKNTTKCRVVFHIDMDCFFAAVVLRSYPQYVNKPVAIGHSHILSNQRLGFKRDGSGSSSELSTCNYEARKYGVEKGMWLHQAKQLCPDLVVLPYDYEGYEEVSLQIADVIHRYSELYNGSVEQVSCDEFYLELKQSIEINVKQIADDIRADIERETECTASIGTGQNKLLAKLSSEKAKPNKTFVCDDWKKLMENLKLSDIPGVGYVSSHKLIEKQLFIVSDIWMLGSEGEKELSDILGKANGKRLYSYCCGVDNRPVAPVQRKSIGAECNYGVRFNGPYGVDYMISCLAKEVEKRMGIVGVTGKRLTLKLMQRKEGAKEPSKFNGHGSCNNISKTCDIPGKPVKCQKILASLANKLFHEIGVEKDDIRGMGIVVSSLVFDDALTQNASMASWLKVDAPSIQKYPLSQTPPHSPHSITTSSMHINEKVEHKNYPSFKNDTRLDTEDSKIKYIQSDILLPSQIDDNVLNELPIHVQDEILRSIKHKLENDSRMCKGCNNQNTSKDKQQGTIQPPQKQSKPRNLTRKRKAINDRHTQLNVKEMIDLQKLKNDRETFQNLGACDLSLTQLSELPVSLQLDVINGRTCGTNSIKTKPPHHAVESFHKSSSSFNNEANLRVEPMNNIDDKIIRKDNSHELSVDLRFYWENIIPLHDFMNEHSEAVDTHIERVASFLSLCLYESRPNEAIILLRSIKRRNDKWRSAYGRVLHLFLDTYHKKYQYRLDTVHLDL